MAPRKKPAKKLGRPTKYRPEMCDTLVALMGEGASITEVSAALDISRETVYDWAKNNPVFSDALQRGLRNSEAWWERTGRTNLEAGSFRTGLWYANMKNRFGWRDKADVHVTTTLEDLVAGVLDDE